MKGGHFNGKLTPRGVLNIDLCINYVQNHPHLQAIDGSNLSSSSPAAVFEAGWVSSVHPAVVSGQIGVVVLLVAFLAAVVGRPNGSDMGSVFAEVAGSGKDLKRESKENNGGELHLAGGSLVSVSYTHLTLPTSDLV